uniref:Uncharacterized protein n=1 Tax=Arundo donax TaxID=35708 RepID=A0A0A8XNQ9_ARUDO
MNLLLRQYDHVYCSVVSIRMHLSENAGSSPSLQASLSEAPSSAYERFRRPTTVPLTYQQREGKDGRAGHGG